MTGCERFRDLLDDVAAGDAADAAIDAHLSACASCAAALQRNRALLARVEAVARGMVTAPTPSGMAERVLARVREAVPLRDASRRSWVGTAVLGAAASVAILIGARLAAERSVVSTMPPPIAKAIQDWHSPTAALLQPTASVLDLHAPGRLLDHPRPLRHIAPDGGNHAG